MAGRQEAAARLCAAAATAVLTVSLLRRVRQRQKDNKEATALIAQLKALNSTAALVVTNAKGDAFAAKFVVCGKNQKCSGKPKSTRTATCTMGPDCMSYGDESEASNLGLSKGEVAAAGSILGNILGHL